MEEIKIQVVLGVDKERILGESGQENLTDAIVQELGWLRDSGMFVDGWEFVGTPEEELSVEKLAKGNDAGQAMREGRVFALAEAMAALKAEPEEHMIAADMWALREDVALTDKEAYVLASKLVEAHASWFGAGLLHQEYIDGLRWILENGLDNHYLGNDVNLNPEETIQLLLNADNQVFGTIVEAAAVENFYRFEPDKFQVTEEDKALVKRAVDGIQGLVESVDDVVAEASGMAEPDSRGGNEVGRER